jgi:DNA-directed RNA polymerase alpha subunit
MLKELIYSSELITNVEIKATEKHILDLYLSNKSIEVIVRDTELSERLVTQIINSTMSVLSNRIKELINKEIYFNENKNKIESKIVQQSLNLFPGAKLVSSTTLSARARSVLDELKIIYISDLSFLTLSILEKRPKTGKKTITEILDIAKEYNIEII